MKRSRLYLSLSVLTLTLGACRSGTPAAPDAAGTLAGPPVDRPRPTLHVGLDRYHMPVRTSSEAAQRWFDQGLQLAYGFNHGEAIRSFEQALALDPDCAMAWWGIAYAAGPNINEAEISPARHAQGHAAAQRALAMVDGAPPVEAALIRAVARRYAASMPSDVAPLNEAYSAGMRAAYRAHPEHPDVGVLYADALMNEQPWDYWTAARVPKGNAQEIVSTLEHVLDLEQIHPGAMHFYIHVMENGPSPEKAVPVAERLHRRIPGAGHLVHMPAHIYAVVGRWSDAADVNEAAIAADLASLASIGETEFYWGYYGHNLHFLAYAAMMEGRYDTAMRAARQLWRDLPDAFVREAAAFVEGIVPTKYHVMIRFGRWDEILAEPAPPAHYIVGVAVHHYARSIAHSALGQTRPARTELEAFEAAAAEIPPDWRQFNNRMADILPIARAMVRAELLYREGEREQAFALLREGARAEDALIYDEPPGWMVPVRHALGALLMAAERYPEAETAYREDLERNPDNGWGLLGLEQALRAQGETRELADLRSTRQRAWTRADTRPTSSCYCEPGRTEPGSISQTFESR